MNKNEGLSIRLLEKGEPILIECGEEKIQVCYSERSSKGCIILQFKASPNVCITGPHLKERIKQLKEENAHLKNRLGMYHEDIR